MIILNSLDLGVFLLTKGACLKFYHEGVDSNVLTLKIIAQGVNSVQRVTAKLHYFIEENCLYFVRLISLPCEYHLMLCGYSFVCFFSFMLELEELSYVLEFN